MKILIRGPIFNPTGFGTVNREIARKLMKTDKIQSDDIFTSKYEFSKGLEKINNAIDIKNANTLYSDYPQFWQKGVGKMVGHWVHEGTKLPQGYAQLINNSGISKLWVPSKATYNLFKWNDILIPMKIIPYGVNDLYYPEKTKNDDFIFLSVNSWTGNLNDRKGTDLLIKAFNEEFKLEEKVKLTLKIGTFFMNIPLQEYVKRINEICGRFNPNIMINNDYITEKDLAEIYRKSDCFVSPTRGESFGLTMLNAMASGIPLICTHDINSGHMDYTNYDSVLYVDAPNVVQGDRQFFTEGCMLADPDLESLKKQMRYAFENKTKLKRKAMKNSKKIREKYTWENTAKQVKELFK